MLNSSLFYWSMVSYSHPNSHIGIQLKPVTMEDFCEIDLATATTSGNVPFWFSQGHIRDDLAKAKQAAQQQQQQQLVTASPTADNNNNSAIKFLSALQKPVIGMCTYTSIYGLDGTSMHLTGTITTIHEEPSTEDLSQSDSLLWGLLSENPDATSFHAKSPEDKKSFISNFLGGVHGQRVTGVAMLHEEDRGGASQHLLPQGATVEIIYKFNDTMYYPWVVESFCLVEKPPVATSHVKLTLPPRSPTTTLWEDVTIASIAEHNSSSHPNGDDFFWRSNDGLQEVDEYYYI